MSITAKQIIGELVAEDYRTATVFKERNIDFCCNGDRTIGEACALKKIDENEVLGALEEVTRGKDIPTDHPRDMAPDELAD
ncbi:MAG: DUF542 domain-containing protein, partial [Ekhidna sp.]